MSKSFSISDVKINDNLVPAPLRRRITALMRLPIWAYGWTSNPGQDRFCFWHAHFAGGDWQARQSCEPELLGTPELAAIADLWLALKRGPLRGHEPLRVYANSQTFGLEGYVHTDSKDTRNYFSTIYYPMAVWRPDWAGETLFYSRDRTEIVTSVTPRPGRAVTFPGAMPHCARAPSRDCPELRTTIVFKTQKIGRG